MPIDPTAVVARGAEIDPSADIGPYCIIGPHVKIGARSQLIAHVVVDNHTEMGADNVIHPFARVGGPPQDLKYRGEPARLIIGSHNVIREGATLNIGTEAGRMESRIGNHCLLMAYTHVAHDCTIGDHVVMANSAGLAGHVDLGDHVIVAGLAGVHQFCKVGHHAFVGAGAMVPQSVPPFCVAQGDRAQLVGINVVGLRRAGWSKTRLQQVRKAFKRLFQSSTTRMMALEHTEETLATESSDVAELCAFIRHAERGVCPPRTTVAETDPEEEQ